MTIAFHEWNAQAGSVPVLLQHGFAASTEANWHATGVVDALVAAGRHVVGVDARGHGHSQKSPDSALYGEPAMAADLSAVADALELREFHLVGYSMGAIVALLAAADDPRITRLVVGGVGSGVIETGGVDTRAVDGELVVAALLAEGDLGVYPEGVLAFRRFADAIGADRPSLAAQARAIHHGGVALERIVAPTLVVAGRDDELAANPEVLADALPNGRLHLVDGDHLLAVVAPDFAPTVVEFLAG